MTERSKSVRTASARFAATAAVLLLGAAVSGCSSVGGMFGSSSSSSTSGSSDLLPAASGAQAAATPATPADFDCPSVEVRAGASTLTINAAGKPVEGGALDLRYQGSIVRTARECQLVAGNVNLRVGIEGRIVLGPAGGPGNLEVPIRLVVVKGDRDPGYGSTSKMITEAALCLLQEATDTPGGIWTTAPAMGDQLIARLQANLQSAQQNLSKIQDQLSSGQRLTVPSDDPAAATRLEE